MSNLCHVTKKKMEIRYICINFSEYFLNLVMDWKICIFPKLKNAFQGRSPISNRLLTSDRLMNLIPVDLYISCVTWYHPTTFHFKKKNWFRAIGLNENSFITLGIFLFETPRSRRCLMLSNLGLVTIQTIYSQFHLPVQDSTKASVKLQYLKTMNLGKYQ